MRFFAVVICSFLFLTSSSLSAQSQQQVTVSGTVLNQKSEPLQFASIYVEELSNTFLTDYNGKFTVKVPYKIENLHIKISMVGNKTQRIVLKKIDFNTPFVVRMEELSFTLQEINVNPLLENTKNSNSSIVFDEEAIERIQAFSLIDILNTIPGRATTRPSIDGPQTITLRGNQGGVYDLNNSLGVAIIMDGINISNDANMQARSSSQWGMASSILGGANATSSGDVPFQGIDLREIPVESIEKVEIIQGVPSAQFSELTDGAILIDRKAAKTPLSIVTNVNGASTNFSLSKGVGLPHKLGALNVGVNYAISNPDPRDKIKQFDRVNTSLMWSSSISKRAKNTFSFDFNKRIDEMKFDPDDEDEQTSLTKDYGIRLSNRFSIHTDNPIAKSINLSTSFSRGKQHSYKQWRLNQVPKGYSFKDTTGIYEGVILSGRYIAEEEIIGEPITASVNLNLTATATIADVVNVFSYGFSSNYSNNGGKGIIADPDKPRWINNAGQNARPYSFEYLAPLINYGFFVSDNFTLDINSRKLVSNLGFRVDQQNRSWSLQPRLSTVLKWNSNLHFTTAFGISSKSPTMAHLYPAPTFLDIPLIIAFNSNDAVYLVHTEKILADNSHLKPSKSMQTEFGMRYKHKYFNTSMNFFFKNNRDGFSSVKTYREITVPNYEYHYDETLKEILYNPTGESTTYTNLGNYNIANVLNSKSYGVDWMLNINKVESINSSFTVSTSLIYSEENPKTLEIVNLTAPLSINQQDIWYALYPAKFANKKINILSKLGSTTHIPKLGFVVMSNFDLFWHRKTTSKYGSKIQSSIGFVGTDGQNYNYPEGFDKVPVRDLTFQNSEQPFIYGCLNLSVAKEIKKKIRIAVTAYNVLNIQPEHIIYSGTNTDSFTVSKYNSPVSITGGISLKF